MESIFVSVHVETVERRLDDNRADSCSAEKKLVPVDSHSSFGPNAEIELSGVTPVRFFCGVDPI